MIDMKHLARGRRGRNGFDQRLRRRRHGVNWRLPTGAPRRVLIMNQSIGNDLEKNAAHAETSISIAQLHLLKALFTSRRTLS